MEVVIPNLGDIDEVEVIEICVSIGDEVAENDILIVIESDKASMEIPAPAAGTVDAINVSLGDQVKEGDLVAQLNSSASVTSSQPQQEPDSDSDSDSDTETAAADQSEAREPAPAQAEETVAAASSANAAESSGALDVLVPDLGDASEVVVIEIAVQPGDAVDVNDLLVVLESDKASMEIAAEHAGTVTAVAVTEGQEVEQGTLIATLEVAADVAAPSADVGQSQDQPAVDAPATEESPAAKTPSGALPPAQPARRDAGSDTDADVKDAARVYAGPAVRRLARELGVQLSGIKGSGNRNRITKDDVKAHVKALMSGQGQAGAASGSATWPRVAPVDFAKFGTVEMVELTRVQESGAANLHRSWVNLPHVTQHDEADVTDMEAFRQLLKSEGEQRGVKVTPLAFLIKACCRALREYPRFNASLHEDGKQLVVKQYINIGMADTPQGLVVPVIKAADQKSIWELSAEVADLSLKARDKKLGLDDLQGGTFSISSLGALGGTGFTPIVNAPEVAILGVAKLQTKPLWDGETFQPRKVLPLSLSYDHRVINGADGGRFMLLLTTILQDIRRLAL